MEKEIILKPGITGFVCDSKVTKDQISGFIYALCRELNYKLEEIIDPKIARNYYRILLSKRDEKFELVCNDAYPYAAVTKPIDETNCLIDFIDVAEIKNYIDQNTLFTVLDLEFLNSKVSDDIYRNLSKHEQKEIDYFKPKNLGELIFNYYD